MADTLKTMPISSLTDVTPDANDKLVTYRDSDKSAHVSTVGELAEGMNANISDAFSSSKSYAVGDYCIYNDTLYKCTKAHSGSWSASDFEAVTVADELSELNTNVITPSVLVSSAPEATWTNIYSFTLTKGIYIIQASVRVGASGQRYVSIRLSDDAKAANTVYSSSQYTIWNTLTRVIETSEDTSINVQVYSSSGAVGISNDNDSCYIKRIGG